MVTQKAISLKIDTELLEDLDKEVALGWRKRNNHINEAIRFYLDYQDTCRRLRAYDDKDREAELERYMKKWFPARPW